MEYYFMSCCKITAVYGDNFSNNIRIEIHVDGNFVWKYFQNNYVILRKQAKKYDIF